jgi:hypothetical protein
LDTRRLRLLLVGVSASPALLVVAAWLPWPGTAITRENFARIQEGMTEAEVADLLGGPPDRWEEVGRLPEPDRIHVADWDEPRPWIGADCIVVVRFFDGEVTDKELHDRPSAQESLLDRLRRWFGW